MLNADVRILAVDDSPVLKGRKWCNCVGVLSNGNVTEGIMHFKVERDGSDATERLVETVHKSRFANLVRVLMVHSVTLAGLNILDIKRLNAQLGVPVICITRERPEEGALAEAIRKVFKDAKVRKVKLQALENAGKIFQRQKLHYQIAGMGEADAVRLLDSFHSYPWNLRLAHLIASAIVRGESHGKA